MTRRIEVLGRHDVRRFRSGVPELDAYLRGARRSAERGLGRTRVLLRGDDDPSDWPELLGYFTLSMAELPVEVARRLSGEKLPGYPMPVALIGRLATDERVRGAGVGSYLLGKALGTIVEASSLVACFGVVVDAKDENAMGFYGKHGFTPLRSDGPFPCRCFLNLSTVAAGLAP